MNPRIQNKIEQLKKMATPLVTKPVASDKTQTEDSLAKAIRNEKDAATFMAELNAAIIQTK